MSNRWMRNQTFTPYVNETTIQAGFQTAGAGSPTIFYSKGPYGAGALHPCIASIARTGVGVHLVSFADSYPMLVNAWSQFIGANGNGAQINTINNVGTSSAVTSQITVLQAGAAADVAAGANNIVFFGYCFLNSWAQ